MTAWGLFTWSLAGGVAVVTVLLSALAIANTAKMLFRGKKK